MFSDCVLRQSGRCCLQDGRPQRTDAAAELEAAPTPPPSFTLVGGRGYWQGGGARGVHLTALQVRQSRCSFAEQDMKFGIETHFLFFYRTAVRAGQKRLLWLRQAWSEKSSKFESKDEKTFSKPLKATAKHCHFHEEQAGHCSLQSKMDKCVHLFSFIISSPKHDLVL